MGDENDYGDLQQPKPEYNTGEEASPYDTKKKAGKKPPPKPAPPPEVQYVFHALSSAGLDKPEEFIKSSMDFVQHIWKPKPEQDHYESSKKFEVVSRWDGSVKKIDDPSGEYKLIEFRLKGGAPKAIKLIKDNFSNPNLDPIIPVFICNSAWTEANEPGKPRPGDLRGYTILKGEEGYDGERAILLFHSSAGGKVLAHELSHWCGFSHAYFTEDPDNIGAIGGGGFEITRDQLRKYFKWGGEIAFRKTMAGK